MRDEPTNETTPQSTSSALPQPNDTKPLTDEMLAQSAIGSGPATAAPEPAKKLSKRIKVAIIAGAIVLLAAIGGGSAYAFWYQNPDKVVSDALFNALTAKTISATGKINIEGTDGYKANIEVSARNSEAGNSAVAVKFNINSDDVKLTVNGEGFFSNEGDIYVKLKDVQKLLDTFAEQSGSGISFKAFDGVVKKIDGTWIKISSEDVKDTNEELRTTQKCLADVTKSLTSDESFRETVMSETQALYKDNKFIIVDKSLGSRDINGQGSLGYEVNTDKTKADAFFTGFASTALGKKMKGCDDSIKFDELADEVMAENDAETKAELWVSRFGHTITEINVNSKDKSSTSSFVLNPVFNKAEEVTAPAESLSISEVMKDIEKAYEDTIEETYYYADTGNSYDEDVNYN